MAKRLWEHHAQAKRAAEPRRLPGRNVRVFGGARILHSRMDLGPGFQAFEHRLENSVPQTKEPTRNSKAEVIFTVKGREQEKAVLYDLSSAVEERGLQHH